MCERLIWHDLWKTCFPNLSHCSFQNWFEPCGCSNVNCGKERERGRSLPGNATASRGIGRLCCLRNAVQKRMVKHHHLVRRYTLEIYSSLYNTTGWPSRIWPPNPARSHCYDFEEPRFFHAGSSELDFEQSYSIISEANWKTRAFAVRRSTLLSDVLTTKSLS